MSNRI
ncbi:hypothetical protein D031_1809A, partial [Vibrio parahaemolyticus VP-48]